MLIDNAKVVDISHSHTRMLLTGSLNKLLKIQVKRLSTANKLSKIKVVLQELVEDKGLFIDYVMQRGE